MLTHVHTIDPTQIHPAPVLPPGVTSHPLAWEWACPQCACRTVARVDEHATRAEIAMDARCWDCRRRSTR